MLIRNPLIQTATYRFAGDVTLLKFCVQRQAGPTSYPAEPSLRWWRRFLECPWERLRGY